MSDSIPAYGRAAALPQFVTAGPDGHAVANLILQKLPRTISSKFLAKCQFVQLPTHTVLAETDAPIEHAHFINDGLASILSVLRTGKSVEVGLTGKEGFVGVPLIADFRISATRVIMQVQGSAFRITAKDLTTFLKAFPVLDKLLQRYSQELTLQASQIAACNRLHEVDERMARWLLMSQDRLGGSLIPLTQEFLALMLGTRRASVTVAARALQKSGLISYARGHLKIENRENLEKASCECYATLQRLMRAWKADVQ